MELTFLRKLGAKKQNCRVCSILCGGQHDGADKAATAVRGGGEHLVTALSKRQRGSERCGVQES